MWCLLLMAVSCSTRRSEAVGPQTASIAPEKTPTEGVIPAPVPSVAKSPPLELGAEELAAIAATCESTCAYKPCKCDGALPLAGFLLVHLFLPPEDHAWYVLQRQKNGYVLLTETEDYSDEGEVSQVTKPDRVCFAPRVGAVLAAGVGVVRVEHPDLNLDGRPDLLLECSEDNGDDRYLRYCLSGEPFCEERLQLREAHGGVVRVDVDVEFLNGWFVRTVREERVGNSRGNLRVNGVKTADPRP